MKVLLLGDENLSFSSNYCHSRPEDSIDILCCLPEQELHESAKEAAAELQKLGYHILFGINPAQIRASLADEIYDEVVYILPALAFFGCPDFIPFNSDMFRLRLHLFCFGFLKSCKTSVKVGGTICFVLPDPNYESLPFETIEIDKLAKFCGISRSEELDTSFDISPFQHWKPLLHGSTIEVSDVEWIHHLKLFVLTITDDKNDESIRLKRNESKRVTDGRGDQEKWRKLNSESERVDSLQFDEYNVLKIPTQVFDFNRETLPHVNECFYFYLHGATTESCQISKLSLKYDPRISGWRGDHERKRDGKLAKARFNPARSKGLKQNRQFNQAIDPNTSRLLPPLPGHGLTPAMGPMKNSTSLRHDPRRATKPGFVPRLGPRISGPPCARPPMQPNMTPRGMRPPYLLQKMQGLSAGQRQPPQQGGIGPGSLKGPKPFKRMQDMPARSTAPTNGNTTTRGKRSRQSLGEDANHSSFNYRHNDMHQKNRSVDGNYMRDAYSTDAQNYNDQNYHAYGWDYPPSYGDGYRYDETNPEMYGESYEGYSSGCGQYRSGNHGSSGTCTGYDHAYYDNQSYAVAPYSKQNASHYYTDGNSDLFNGYSTNTRGDYDYGTSHAYEHYTDGHTNRSMHGGNNSGEAEEMSRFSTSGYGHPQVGGDETGFHNSYSQSASSSTVSVKPKPGISKAPTYRNTNTSRQATSSHNSYGRY